MKVTDFTTEEAQAIVQIAESAPLANMKQATAVSALLRKFAAWYPLTQQKDAQPELTLCQDEKPQA